MSDAGKLAKKIRHGIFWRAKRVPPFQQIFHTLGFMRRDHMLAVTYPEVYEKFCSRPVDPKKVIFVENTGRRVSDNFALVLEDLKRDGSYRIHVYYLEELTAEPGEYPRNCARLAADAATASCIFLNDHSNVISCLPLREETKVIQMWHACGAFKKFGRSTLTKLFGQTEKDQRKHPIYGYGNLDYVTVSSEEVVWAYTEAMQLEDKKTQVLPVGVSRTDRFFDAAFRDKSVHRVLERFPAAQGKKIVLYAPTFRGRVHYAETPDFTLFNLEELHKKLGEEYVFLIKHHPFVAPESRPEIPEGLRETYAADVTEDLPIEALLCAADIVVTDYSSLIFEYSLLNRPMIFYAYDLDDYFDWRGFYYDYEEMTPGPVCRTMEELTDALAHAGERFDAARLGAFRKKFMGGCDGHATERIEELMFGRSLRG